MGEKKEVKKEKGTGRRGSQRGKGEMAEEREGAVSGEGKDGEEKRGDPIEKPSVKMLAVQSCLALQPHRLCSESAKWSRGELEA